MPFIHIKSLPDEQITDKEQILLDISRGFASENGIPLQHVLATWEYYQPGHYVNGRSVPKHIRAENHVLIIDLLTPDFNNSNVIEKMLTTLSRLVSQHANVAQNKIFINHRHAHSGMVFDDGEIVHW